MQWTLLRSVLAACLLAAGCGGTSAETSIAVQGAGAADEFTLFGNQVPARPVETTDSGAVELGIKFRSSEAGEVRGIRFFRGVEATQGYTVDLWSRRGTKLASARLVASPGKGPGWREARFDAPVPIQANRTYVASYHAPSGRYAFADQGLRQAILRGPLLAPGSPDVGGNGVFRYGAAGTFPNTTYRNSHYFVDVIFASTALPKVTPDAGLDETPPADAATKADQGARPTCGNGSCEAGESCSSCASDCGACPSGNLATIGGCTMFTADDEWNRDVSTLPVDPKWTTYFNGQWGKATITVVFGTQKGDRAGVPWNLVPQDQPLLPVYFGVTSWGPSMSDPGPYPFPGPQDVWIQQGDVRCSMNTDCHILTLQRGTCMLYEGWACRWGNNRWECGAGAKFDLKKNSYGQRPMGWTSAEAAGLPMLPGIIRHEEVASGEIKHALRFSTACTGWDYVRPASHGAKPDSCPVDSPPLGLRIRLKSTFNTSGFNKEAQVVLKALKKYGALLGDNNPGSAGFSFQADVDTGWAPGQLYDLWNKIPNSAFEVLQTYQ